MESALPRTLFVNHRWVAVVGVVSAAVVAAVVFYAVSQNPGGHALPISPTPPSHATAPTVTGFVRESGGDTRGASSAWTRMSDAKLVVTGTTAEGATVVRHLRAGAQGQFKLSLPNGHYRIYAIAYGPASAPLARQPHSTVTVIGGRPIHIRLTASTL